MAMSNCTCTACNCDFVATRYCVIIVNKYKRPRGDIICDLTDEPYDVSKAKRQAADSEQQASS